MRNFDVGGFGLENKAAVSPTEWSDAFGDTSLGPHLGRELFKVWVFRAALNRLASE